MEIIVGDKYGFLNEVYVNDFDDNYHKLNGDPSSELEGSARKIRRRYKNVQDYLAAMSTYNQYMNLIMEQHGGKQLYKIQLKNDMIYDFIPPFPQLKNTPKNRFFLKKGIIVSKVNVDKINKDVLDETLDLYDKSFNKEEDFTIITDNKVDPIAKKMIKEGDFNRINPRKVAQISDIEFLEEYFKSKKSNVNKEREKKVKKLTLTQYMNGEADSLITDTSEEDEAIFYRGRYMSRSSYEELKTYRELSNLGWNPVTVMKKKGASKKLTKIVKNQLGDNKKYNKKGKKKKNKRSDDFFVKLMDDNHDTFADYERDMLNFTADNVFKK